MFKNYKVNVNKNHRPYVKLIFKSAADTTVPIYYTKESFVAKKPDQIIPLKANEQKTTVINKPEIYRFGVVDYDPSTGKYISSNINIISARIEGTILDGYGLFDRVKSMTECDVSKMDTSKMTSMFCMFQLCSALTALDVTHFDTSKVTDMSYMFNQCSKLTTLDVSKWDTSNVADMHVMFSDCSKLTELDISHFNTSKVTNMFGMFADCPVLTTLNVTNFDTSKVTDMSYMFYDCSKLTTVGPVDTAPGWQHKPNKYDNMFNNCPATPKPSWYKEFNNNGFEYVDLGLPSGTLWATQNVGASKPSDYGLFFQWGDTSGYTANQVGNGEGQKKFDWADYKWNPSGDGKTFTKYNKTDNKKVLELEDDAAHVHMGGTWHMPTPEQIDELTANTTSTWTAQDGVNGRLFTSKKDSSKSIFIPAAGDAWDGSVSDRGMFGYVWSSMLSSSNADSGQGLGVVSVHVDLYGNYRGKGFSVRGVLG